MLNAIVVDPSTRTIRPTHYAAEEFFGVAWGTNGTAAECRRALVTQAGYRWTRADGRAPAALQYRVEL